MTKPVSMLECCAQAARGVFEGGEGGHASRDAAFYLAHVEGGESMRALARESGCHASTVLRAVRRVEEGRDDPLFEALIEAAGRDAGVGASAGVMGAGRCGPAEWKSHPGAAAPRRPCRSDEGAVEDGPDHAGGAEDAVRRAAKRHLRRLSEPGAFLFVRPEAEKAGIFCSANGHAKPIALVERAEATEFLRRDWIRLEGRGRASLRYRITEAGRSALRRILAEDRARRAETAPAPGFAEAVTPFQAQHRLEGERVFADAETGAPVTAKVNLGETPLGWLARRKGPDGRPFLAPHEVEAGERLREDFERAEIGPSVAQDWRRFLTPRDALSGSPGGGGGEGPAALRERVSRALAVLGPGLSDVALRTCCFLEGLEACEKRMGWSARSGKVVLKLALARLAEHYGIAPAPAGRGEEEAARH